MRVERNPWRAWLVVPALVAGLAAPVQGKKDEPPPAPEGIYLGDTDTPNLYQMMGRSEVVVRAELVGVSMYARFRAQEVYVGRLESPELEVVYRGLSWERRVDGQEAIHWEKGDEYLLFLSYWREKDKVVRPDLFELRDGDWGSLRLDGENDTVYIEAMRLLIGAAARSSYAERNAVLIGIMGSPNYLAAGAAMYQVAEAGIATVDTIPAVLSQMDRGIVALKFGALRVLRKVAPTIPPSMDRESVAEAIHARIAWTAGDPVEIREQAVDVLAALGPAAARFLQAASREDPDQRVRYKAAVHLLELKG